jgi:hypothetical protein
LASYFKQTLNLRWKKNQKALGHSFVKGKGLVKGHDKGKAYGWQQYQPDKWANPENAPHNNWQTDHKSHDEKWATDDEPENVGNNLTRHNDQSWGDVSSPGACASTAEPHDPVLIAAAQEPGQPQLGYQDLIERQADLMAQNRAILEFLESRQDEAEAIIAAAHEQQAQEILASAGDALAEAAAPATPAFLAPKAKHPAEPTTTPEAPKELTAEAPAAPEALIEPSEPTITAELPAPTAPTAFELPLPGLPAAPQDAEPAYNAIPVAILQHYAMMTRQRPPAVFSEAAELEAASDQNQAGGRLMEAAAAGAIEAAAEEAAATTAGADEATADPSAPDTAAVVDETVPAKGSFLE